MSDLNSVHPVDHTAFSSAAKTAGEAGKGTVRGVFKGMLGGGLLGGLGLGLLAAGCVFLTLTGVGALAVAAGGTMAGFGASAITITSAIVGIGAGIFGAGVGGAVGGAGGGIFGLFKGFGKGRDIVKDERAMASAVQTQSRIAEAQIETARGMQAMAISSVMSQMPQPGNKVTGTGVIHAGAKPLYVGAAEGASAVERYTSGKQAADFAQMVEQQALAAEAAGKGQQV